MHPGWPCDKTCSCEKCGYYNAKLRDKDEEHCACICEYLKCECCYGKIRT